MKSPAVLVVDDDESARTYISRFLSSQGYVVDCLASGELVMSRIDSPKPPSLLLLDVRMPNVGGLEVLAHMEETGRRVPTIVVSGVDQVGIAVKAMKMGASDYLLKPFDEEELELAVRHALEDPADTAVAEPSPEPFDDSPAPDFTSANAKMRRVKETARRVAGADVPVLILGESGVGKEVLAKYIHAVSPRCHHPFVKVNCAALPAELMESELFGYDRGAFTGAWREKQGKFELADKGTILLDEIGEMSPLLQAKLLHVLQDGEYPRLGSSSVVRVDVRVIATTNKKLEEAVAKGEFRLDLFYRLNVIKLSVPPLRERPEDIVRLSHVLMNKHLAKYGGPPVPLSAELEDAFRRYDWPGNVRQLENVVKRLVVLRDVDLVLSDLASPELPGLADSAEPGGSVFLKEVSAMAAERAEKDLVLRLLEERNWNRKQVARELNICYKSLLNKLHRWQIPAHGRSAAAIAATFAKTMG